MNIALDIVHALLIQAVPFLLGWALGLERRKPQPETEEHKLGMHIREVAEGIDTHLRFTGADVLIVNTSEVTFGNCPMFVTVSNKMVEAFQ